MHKIRTMEITNVSWIEHFDIPKELIQDDLFSVIWEIRPQQVNTIIVYGKSYSTPRLQQAYGMDYKFSGTTFASLPIPECIQPVMDFMCKKYNTNFNGVLINWYRDGNDYISHHSDNEKQLVKQSPIVTISLGESRDFVLKHKTNKTTTKYTLKHNSILVMGGLCQEIYTHSVPKRKNVTKPRISITLRHFA